MDVVTLAFARDGAPLPPDALNTSLTCLRGWCRGGLASWRHPHAELAATVLAVDDSAGLALGFDGRLDNRDELVDALGRSADNLSDAQLLLARYRALGASFLDSVDGSFAVGLVDSRRGLALAARDGMGNRYLSTVLTPGLFAVASVDVALLGMPGVSGALDPLRLAEYYGGESPTGPETFFRDVRAVMPAEMVIVDGDGVHRRPLPGPRLDERLDLPRVEDYVELFAQILREAVARRLRGLDRVAVLTSGGLDSSPIAALAARLLPSGGSGVTALSWRLSDPDGDESQWVEAVSRESRLDLQWIPCDDALPYSDLGRWPVHPSTPEQTTYRWFHQRSYARAEELGHRVVLAGFGGDQLYAGARGWFWSLLAGEELGPAVDRLRDLAEVAGWRYVLRSVVVAPLVHRVRPPQRPRGRWLTPEARRRLAGRPIWPDDLASARRPHQARLVLALAAAHGSSVERLYAEQFGLGLGWPLRDARLVQLALAVPDHLLDAGLETRPILRRAVCGLVPEEVRLRRGKASFRSVLRQGLDPRRLGWARELLADQDAVWRGVVGEGTVRAWLAREIASETEEYAFCQCLHAELWRYVRGGGDLQDLESASASARRRT